MSNRPRILVLTAETEQSCRRRLMPSLLPGQPLIVEVTQQEVYNSTTRKLRQTGGT